MSGDIVTNGGFVIPASTHERYQAQRRRKRRAEVRLALELGGTVSYSVEQLKADGWGPRQIRRVTK